MPWTTLALVVGSAILVGAFVYWHIVITEGVYLGQAVVTWLYDLTAPRYDQIKQFDREFESRFLGRPLCAALSHSPAPLVLDIATGSGRLPITLLEQPSFQGRIVGVDASRPMLEQAARRLEGYRSRVSLIWRDAADLPFPDGCFDAVTMLEMLEFTPSPIAQLREAVRLLRPGGILMTTRRCGVDAKLMPGKTFSHSEFASILEPLGLEDVRIEAWQVDYDLVWASRRGSGLAGARPLSEYLLCPACRTASLIEMPAYLECERCGRRDQIARGIIDLR